MSEPVVTPTSDNHSAPISKKAHPHSVAHETVPPESRPVGEDHHGTTGPNDPPPGTAEGEQYPPQLHAGKVGYGPHIAEVKGKDQGLGAKLTGVKEQIKGKITRNPDLVQKGHARAAGELKAEEQAEDDKSPFQDTQGRDEPTTDTTTAPPTNPGNDGQSPLQGAGTRESAAPTSTTKTVPAQNVGATAPPDAPRDVGVENTDQRH